MVFRSRRRRRYGRNFLFGNFYLNLGAQYTTTIVAAIVLAGLIFTGFLLFRYNDKEDLLARGRRQMAEGKVAWASQTFETLVNKHEGSYQGHVELGKAYLALGDRRKAEKQFRIASSLKGGKHQSSAAEIAQSKINIAQKQFEKAEEGLLTALEKSPDNKDLRLALYELYENWGRHLISDESDYAGAIEKYEAALAYVPDYELEKQLVDNLTHAMSVRARDLETSGKVEEALAVYESSLRYQYDADTLIHVAEMYERTGDLDQAIVWYRKAFDANPEIISIKLSNMLIKKGRQLLANNQVEAAEGFFAEADRIIQTTDVPPAALYPVEITRFDIEPDLDYETGMLMPVIKLTFENESHRKLDFLATRVMFLSDTDVITEAYDVVASPEEPLLREDKENAHLREMTIRPNKRINVHALQGKTLKVKVAIAYSQDEDTEWEVKAIKEIKIQGPPTPPGAPAA